MRPDVFECLVTDGQWRKSIAAIRSLGAAGHRVTVMGDSIFTTGFWSRFTSARVLCPSAQEDPKRFGACVDRFLEKRNGGGKVLYFMEDASIAWACAHADEIASRGGKALLPTRAALEIASDKGRTEAVARELGLAVPQTWQPRDADHLEQILDSMRGRALVVKPCTASGSAGIVYLGGPVAAPDWHGHWAQHGPLLVQERVPAAGRAIGVSLLFDRSGECKASFAHERLRQYPITGGPSTDRVSILYPELVERSIRLLRSLRWRGVAMVEWKVDPADDQPKLLEINPRFWGSLELAIRCGVDFPLLYAKAAQGLEFAGVHTYAVGRRCRWLIPGEVLRFMSEERGRRESFRQFLAGLPRDAEEWDSRDLRGSIACVVCPALLLLNPKYWRYLRRR